jgi:hypothetical protein
LYAKTTTIIAKDSLGTSGILILRLNVISNCSLPGGEGDKCMTFNNSEE